MLEKGKISAFQLGVMMYSVVLATGYLVLPAIAAQSAKNDLWITGIFASLIGFLNVYMVTRLHQLYPKETVIQYSEHIVGKIIGKIIGMGLGYPKPIIYLLYNKGPDENRQVLLYVQSPKRKSSSVSAST